MKRKLILHATNEHPAIYREGHRLVAGKDTNEVQSKEKSPAMNNLLPCPFCGGTSISIDRLDTGDPKYPDFVAQCFDCGASTGTHSEETFAAEAWDKRAGQVATGFARDLQDFITNHHNPAVAKLNKTIQALSGALRGVIRQLPVDERLANYNLDFAESALAEAEALKSKAH